MSAVEITGLTKRFAPSGPPTLDEVAFAVANGSITCLLGPSGSGKSTILGCIAGLIAPDAGTITSATSTRWPYPRIGGRSRC